MLKKPVTPLKLWQKIFHLADYMHEICSSVHSPEEIKTFHDMPLSQINMIKRVRKLTRNEPEGISLKALAQDLGISAAAASEQVNILVNKDLLCREASTLDRRAICLKLSQTAVDKFNKVEQFLDIKTGKFLEEITPEDAAELGILLDKFINKMESIRENSHHEDTI